MIDLSVPVWDPPPQRPSIVPAALVQWQVRDLGSALKSRLYWVTRDRADDGARDLPGLGGAALIASGPMDVGGTPMCGVSLGTLDSNLVLSGHLTVRADLSSEPCADLPALESALIADAHGVLDGI
ncbi:hypothetical protein [Actinoplanes sp. NBRC 101535]|uniref:hypothetical protein n=1 Tax=Actinoplanes sp. NBRC 101535 TaxID=3032196 RepID=UPI0024A0719C|nr:hypothetical protein [Actinoplanes sp. NBRC 101535]GLY07052.1 hypothetical protein Acsp01_74310 [Actinoplanes sp. NBRC 101535]